MATITDDERSGLIYLMLILREKDDPESVKALAGIEAALAESEGGGGEGRKNFRPGHQK